MNIILINKYNNNIIKYNNNHNAIKKIVCNKT